ncbi:DUF2080 family transposase-associated protein [Desulforhabdus amnigena]|nr:DUF2080 family transposase-associated protein [Deltaproteobacteria bacterium]
MVMEKKDVEEEKGAHTEIESPGEAETARTKVKFEVYGEEMLEKEVKLSGNSGRVYLPPDWVGHRVKIIRID